LAIGVPEAARQILPRNPRARHVEDGVKKQTIVFGDSAMLSWLARKEVLNSLPIRVADRMTLGHSRGSRDNSEPLYTHTSYLLSIRPSNEGVSYFNLDGVEQRKVAYDIERKKHVTIEPIALAPAVDRVVLVPSLSIARTTLTVCDAKTGKPIHSLAFKNEQSALIQNAVLSDDGKWLALIDAAGRLQVWDVEDKKELFTFSSPSYAMAETLRFRNDKSELLFGTPSGSVFRLELKADAKPVLVVKHEGGVTGINVSADERRLYTLGYNQLIRIWDLQTNKPLAVSDGYVGTTSFALTHDGQHILIADATGRFDSWNLESGKRVRTLQEAYSKPIDKLLSTADGRTMLVVYHTDELCCFDLVKQQFANTIPFKRKEFKYIGLNGTGTIVYGMTPWNTFAYDIPAKKMLWENQQRLGAIALDPHGRWLVSSGRFDGKDFPLGLLDPQTGKVQRTLLPEWPEPQEARIGRLGRPREIPEIRVTGLCSSLDGERFIGVAEDGTLRQWNPFTGKELSRVKHHTLVSGFDVNCWSTAVSPDGKWLVVGGDNHSLSVWEVASSELVLELAGHDSPINQVAFTRGGRGLVSNGELSPILWDLRPKDVQKLPTHDAKWWDELRGEAPVAYRWQWAFIQDPTPLITLAKERIKTADWVYAKDRFDNLVRDLDASRFSVREVADKELTTALFRIPKAWLREAVAKSKTEEVNTRLGRLIAKREKDPDYEGRRLSRVVQVLELANTAECKELLREWAKGGESLLVAEAKGALERMAGK
jgi:WD40 repeat protein